MECGKRKRVVPEIVIFEDRKKKKQLPIQTQDVEEHPQSVKNSTKNPIFNIKKARHDVHKFVISGLDKSEKEDAKVALAVQLGAKPPKNKHINYKELLASKRQEKDAESTSAAPNLMVKKFALSAPKKQYRRDRNDVAAFDSQIGKFRKGVQMINKHDVFRIKRQRRNK